jgi:4-hydroxy-tetrahydrodipicolinate synthase
MEFAYNNPLDTKVDLTPRLLAKLHGEGLIVAVKEFAGDPRRAYALLEQAPTIDALIGSDDTVLEIALAGAKGWIAGYASVFPRACVALYHAAVSHDIESTDSVPSTARPVALGLKDRVRTGDQAVMDIVGRNGGTCRAPRMPLNEAYEAEVR